MPKKEVKKESKIKLPKNFSWVGKVVDWVAVSIAYILLFTAATYGIRRFLETIPDWANYGMTTIIILAMVYIIFRSRK